VKFLILTHRSDVSAVAVAAALSRRHPAGACRLVTAEELILAPGWAHRVDACGVGSRVRLHDGMVLDSGETGAVLHRLYSLDLPRFGHAHRDYAFAEMSALLQSWLKGLPCPVFNPVGTRGFCVQHSPVGWLALATKAGLLVPRLRLTSNLRRFPAKGLQPVDGSPLLVGRGFAFLAEPPGPDVHSVLFAGGEVCGDLPIGLLPACREFVRLAHTPLIRLHFTSGGPHGVRWLFSHAEPLPVLDAIEVAAVVRLLERAADEARSEAAVA
jgi:hypothetical protein